jgi:hypothetical protein
MFLNAKHQPLGLNVVSVGSLTSAIVQARDQSSGSLCETASWSTQSSSS